MAPRVLIVGGFLTLPLNYWPMRRRLLAGGAAAVDIAPIWPVDWALASVLSMAPLMRRTRLAILRAYQAADRQPIIVIGHSGGGIAARLAMSAAPFYGQRGGVAEAVGCLVTLGTPHGLAQLPNRHYHAGHEAADFLDRESPGAFFAPRTAYMSVGSKYEQAAFGGVLGRLLEEIFSVVVGDDTGGAGDGIVPFSAVHLDEATQLSFSDARHGHIGANWYGASGVLDRWWPPAVGLWQGALEARRTPATEPAGAPLTLSAPIA